MSTGTEIAIRLFDVTAKEDSSPVCAGSSAFATAEQLRDAQRSTPDCATLERDYFRLDGSLEPFPDAPETRRWGLWSTAMSGDDRIFATPPVLRVSFTKPHSSIGLTLHFQEREGDWCSRLRVRWLDAGGHLLATKEFFPTAAVAFLKKKVEGYYGLELTFLETAKPGRYLKLAAMDYGMELLLDSSALSKASILEEVDPASASVSVNTLDFTVYSATSEFSPLNPNGSFSVLQQRQKLEVTAILEGQRQGMGSFFLERWVSDEKGNLTLHGVDAVGLMDQGQYEGGLYQQAEARGIFGEIFAAARVPYELAEVLAAKRISGHLGSGSPRRALGQLAFAVGGVVDCSRGERVRIYPLPQRPSALIGFDRKFMGQRISLRPVLTGIDLTTHRFTKSEESFTAFEDTLPAGRHILQLAEPIHSPTVTGAALVAWGVNSITLTVATPGKVIVTGKRYLHTRQRFSGGGVVGANLAEKRLRVENATLVSQENAGEVIARLEGYHRNNLISELRLGLGRERVGDMVMVSQQGESIKGMVERMEIDLAGGCLVKMRLAAQRIETVSSSYTGECYTGQKMGVL